MTHPQPSAGPQDLQQPSTGPLTTTPHPPFSGAAYATAEGFPDTGGGDRVPGSVGRPISAPQPAEASNARRTVAVAVSAAVLTLLASAGAIVAVVLSAHPAPTTVSEALPDPDPTLAVGPARSNTRPSTPPPASHDGRDLSPGDTLVVNGDEGTIEITVTKFRSATKPCRSSGDKPDEGVYLIADVTVEVTKGTAPATPTAFQWVATDGTRTRATGAASSGCGKPMPATKSLTAGARRTGSVVFDVPDTAGALEYRHRSTTAGSWKP
ncbi:DUF4352 domain-containing protein [Micromonospora sp. WMMD1120]|uniref:DUF4352 domain-containing protein n=1 Tax=Micromonospora sp. WMMD1120 TaxID=3016106 RepID=UPI002417AD6D|nr:DUF4352 domain-containing protein [Micromonospora sp. WMMD1120]MDG4807772.1 DUF4352 domain-containing protein [Micromonospora sp. WMMD1120]